MGFSLSLEGVKLPALRDKSGCFAANIFGSAAQKPGGHRLWVAVEEDLFWQLLSLRETDRDATLLNQLFQSDKPNHSVETAYNRSTQWLPFSRAHIRSLSGNQG